jgi:gliding motility associated protien GldN
MNPPMKAFSMIFMLICLLLGQNLGAQDAGPLPWQQRDRQEMKPLEYEPIREADVFWSKNLWRVIDTRQKLNKPFSYPPRPLIQIIHEAAKRGELTVYDPAVLNADQFKQVMDTSAVRKMGARTDSVMQIDPLTGEEIMVVYNTEFSWERVTKFRIKEVWFFDENTSTMRVRIIAIAPVMEDFDSDGNYRGDMTMYWIPYANMRNMLAKEEVFNAGNDWQHHSWEDLLEMRYFASYIYKESNVHDRNIQEYATAIDAQLESERIKMEIMQWESDLWNY